MLKFIEKGILNESLGFKDADEVIAWFDTLVIPTRKPNSISSVEHSIMKGIKDTINNYKNTRIPQEKTFYSTIIFQKARDQLRLSKNEYESVYSNNKNEPEVIKGLYATYKHEDVGSYARFLANVKNLEDFFSTLKSFHKKALNNLTVVFVSRSTMSVPAKYKSGKKTILINPLSKKVGNTKEEYGSLRYIILHELGHKYLEENRQDWNISDRSLITTPYSSKSIETMNDEEIFAELFALSNWESKYSKYKTQIEIFKNKLK